MSETVTIRDGIPSDLPAELSVLLGVHLLYWTINEVFEGASAAPALSKNERKVIVHLAVPRRMGELAADMQVLPSTVTLIADELEEKGMLQRERDPQDRRAWQLCLTRKGMETRQETLREATDVFREVTGLSKSETEIVADLMQKVAKNIRAGGLPEGVTAC
ncbi:MarR family transcriptional regulator [Rhodobacteraceae bacterium D3-12]|nr:MarR family transcriptional regulator [Rhodobacteraceae bacterium D3-12]